MTALFGAALFTEYVHQVISADRGFQSKNILTLLFFAAVACILAGIGMYAVLSAFVNQWRREFGIRMALGATPRDVRTKVLTESTLLTCIGSGIGLLLSAGMAVLARSAFLTLNPFDASLYAATVAAMLVTATLSTLAPASAASRMQPMEALRTE
jgi:ABC-type antimicrobial peptide transport system permease subunit